MDLWYSLSIFYTLNNASRKLRQSDRDNCLTLSLDEDEGSAGEGARPGGLILVALLKRYMLHSRIGKDDGHLRSIFIGKIFY